MTPVSDRNPHERLWLCIASTSGYNRNPEEVKDVSGRARQIPASSELKTVVVQLPSQSTQSTGLSGPPQPQNAGMLGHNNDLMGEYTEISGSRSEDSFVPLI